MLFPRAVIFLFIGTVAYSTAFTQRYHFLSYSTEEGLPQSQVFSLAQAADRQLWMATFSGISRFDGKAFHNYTISEGLASNNITQLVLDQQQRVWALTTAHLNCIEGDKITTWPLPEVITSNKTRLAVTADNVLWVLINGTLYSFTNHQFRKAAIPDFSQHAFFALLPGEKNNMYLMAPHRTLYKYQAGSWQRFAPLVLPDSTSRIRNVYIDSAENVWIVSNHALLVKHPAEDKMQIWFSVKDKQVQLSCITKDKAGNFWIGDNTGVYKIRQDTSFVHFDYDNGFSANEPNNILTDVEGNVWLATNGDGLLKYGAGTFTSLDNPGNKANRVTIVMTDKKGNLFFGSTGRDFCVYDGHTRRFPLQGTALEPYQLNCAFRDDHGIVWIGTTGGGLWKYEEGKVTATAFNKTTIYDITQNEGKLILCTEEGLVAMVNGQFIKHPAGNKGIAYTVMPIGKDSLLASRQYGLDLLIATLPVNYPFPADLVKSTVTSFEKRGTNIFISTTGTGIFVWNKTTGKFQQFTTAQGLATNVIYNLFFDSKGQLWAGTGKGMTRLVSTDNYKTVTVRNYGREQGFNGVECNIGTIAGMPDNTIWFGTSKGLYCYHPEADPASFLQPKLLLQAVKLFSKPVTDTANLTLAHKNNHITFEFLAVSYSYSNIRYSYFLDGLEKDFSVPALTNSVVYPSLPPGNYVFKLKAVDESGLQLGDVLTYTFSIEPAFYQTAWFRLLMVILAGDAVWLVYILRKKRVTRQKKLIEILRTEEQKKIRQNTARDFHDEMGNKLARITVLSEILKTKLPDNEEAQALAKKIQENTALVYQGTRDIIWSLNPNNDNLYILLQHIHHFGTDLFMDTDIRFEPKPVNEAFSHCFLPMDFARNIMMICKEAFTNILKHAQCHTVITGAELIDANRVVLTIKDDGKGFDTEQTGNGNGLINIQQRAESIGATVQFESAIGLGTTLLLTFTLRPGAK